MTTPEIGDDVWLWEGSTPEAAKIVAEAHPIGYHVVAWDSCGNTIFRTALPLIDANTVAPNEPFLTVKGIRPVFGRSAQEAQEAQPAPEQTAETTSEVHQ